MKGDKKVFALIKHLWL